MKLLIFFLFASIFTLCVSDSPDDPGTSTTQDPDPGTTVEISNDTETMTEDPDAFKVLDVDEVIRKWNELNGVENQHPEQDFKLMKNPTVMHFSYGDKDPFGPPNWEQLAGAKDNTNFCNTKHYSPLRIDTSKARLGDAPLSVELDEGDRGIPRLVFRIQRGISSTGWFFGHPLDIYNGLQISPSSLGHFQVYDDYDTHQKHGMASRMFDFTFAHVSYCDYSKVDESRSSHQIDGKKFPIELNFLFFWAPLEMGMNKNADGPNGNENYVMVTVLGDVSGNSDNQRWEPLIQAASQFIGTSYESAFNMVKIKPKFSPTWLMPRNSTYYYYENGCFPVPPCFYVPRVYVLTQPVTISERQFKVLTNIKSKREPSGVLACTVGVIQNKTDAEQIYHNPHTIKFTGKDGRPKSLGQSIEQEEGNRIGRNQISISCVCTVLVGLTIYLANEASSN